VASTRAVTDADGRLSDAVRLRRLRETGMLAGAPYASLDRLARAAAHQLRAGWALISLLDADRRVVAGSFGPPPAHTFCRMVLDTDAPLLIGDARADERIGEHPAIGDGVIAYAGFPLRSPDGYILGTFCVIDRRAREWEPRELLLIEDLAGAAETELELRAAARRTDQELARQRRAGGLRDRPPGVARAPADATNAEQAATMTAMPTVFTQIINGDLPGRIVWSDDQVAAFLTISPLTAGHTLVVPRAEVDDWTRLDPALWAHVMEVSRRIGAAVRQAFDAPRAGLVVAGFEVPHAHVHVFPAWQMADFDFARVQTVVPAEDLDAAHKRLLDALGR
jgi:diadenosine tetraphosphate (Ap4A) HIT family hydrolase